jgi:prepilin-type N-terminal cleavage/methylation domain-containing protein
MKSTDSRSAREPSQPRSLRRDGERGFSLTELLAVAVIILTISILAYPSLRSFSGANDDAAAATRLVRLFNQTKDQAKRHNRAMTFEIPVFDRASPGGRVEVRESRHTTCQSAIEAAVEAPDDAFLPAERFPFGDSIVDGFEGYVQERVGLRGWAAGGEPRADILRLCIGPDGAAYRVDRGVMQPVSGKLDVLVQRFEPGRGGWAAFGPPRRVRITFGGGARLVLR